MDTQTIWFIALSSATSVGALVGFVLTLRQLKKTKLENEKLELEIISLKKASTASERLIVPVTTEEVMRISHPDKPMFSRKTSDHARPRNHSAMRFSTQEALATVAIGVAVVIVAGYAVYDFYRLAVWIFGKF